MKGTAKQPGMSFLLLGTSHLLGRQGDTLEPADWIISGQIISILGGVLSCLLVYYITRRLFGHDTALLAGLLACFWPQGAELSGDVLSDMPHLALYLLALLLGMKARASGRMAFAVGCGVVAGCAYWLRQEALGIPLAVSLGLLIASDLPVRKRAILAAFTLLAFVAIVAPQAIIVGNVMPNKDVWQLLRGSPAQASARPALFLAEIIPWWKAPGKMVEQWAFSGRYIFSALVLLALVLRSAARADRRERAIVILAILFQLLAVQLRVKSFGEISSRYLLIPVALTLPWAAAGLHAIFMLIQQSRTRRPQLTLSGILFLILIPLGYMCIRPINREGRAFRDAGSWLRTHAGAQDKIAAHDRLEQLMFYAGRILPDECWVRFSWQAPAEQVVTVLTRTSPAWLVDVSNTRKLSSDDDKKFLTDVKKLTGLRLKEMFRTSYYNREAIVWNVSSGN